MFHVHFPDPLPESEFADRLRRKAVMAGQDATLDMADSIGS